jgi:hypothetical protein
VAEFEHTYIVRYFLPEVKLYYKDYSVLHEKK